MSVADRDCTLSKDEAHSIARLSTLERLREQARSGNKDATVRSIENMIESELRVLRRIREVRGASADQASSEPFT